MHSILILTYYQADKNPGFVRKYEEIQAELLRRGCSVIHRNGSLNFRTLWQTLRPRELAGFDLIWVRCPGIRSWFITLLIGAFKSPAARTVLEWPSPLQTFVRLQYRALTVLALHRVAEFVLFLLTVPLFRFVYDVMLEFGNETAITGMLLGKSRLLPVWNAVDANRLGFVRIHGVDGSEALNLITVGTLENWHGVDRVLDGLTQYYSSSPSHAVNLLVVGQCSADILAKVQAHAGRASASHVRVLGELDGDSLREVISQAHIGLGALGVHRTGLRTCSPLKDGLYASAGLPFVAAYEDPRFDPQVGFRKIEPRTDSPLDIAGVHAWYSNLNHVELGQECHRAARTGASTQKLVATILDAMKLRKRSQRTE